MIRSAIAKIALSIVLLTASLAYANSGELLTFQGLGDLQQVGNFYNGSGPGNTPNYGISFSSNFFGLRSYLNGGAGNFSPTPIGFPALFISNSLSANTGSSATGIMNVTPGFSNGLNFFYSAGFASNQSEVVTVWSGANGTGTVLATMALNNNNAACTAPLYCNWTNVGLSFAGTAHSVTFSGPSNEIGFSDITVGSSITAIPEPSTLCLLGTGFTGLALFGWRRRFRL